MFFKELLHVCILFSYQCSLVLLITHSRQLLYNIMCCFLCQQLFSTFFQLVFALSKKALKTCCFSVVCCCRVQQLWLIYTCLQQKSTIFYKIFLKGQVDQSAQFFFHFLCTMHNMKQAQKIPRNKFQGIYVFSYLLNNSIPTFTLWIVSSLPIISIISVAPAGVICFPETAVLIGQSAYPFLQPLSATYFISIS